MLGNLKNPGRVWRRRGEPTKVDVHGFPDPQPGKAVPYGVYDIGANEAGVSVGISHDTAEFADETGLIVEVCHFPPGTSKWNRIEHRLFCHITSNWRGQPLETLDVVVRLIGSTRTETALEVHCWVDGDRYEKGRMAPTRR